jgi:hypothetical protein
MRKSKVEGRKKATAAPYYDVDWEFAALPLLVVNY